MDPNATILDLFKRKQTTDMNELVEHVLTEPNPHVLRAIIDAGGKLGEHTYGNGVRKRIVTVPRLWIIEDKGIDFNVVLSAFNFDYEANSTYIPCLIIPGENPQLIYVTYDENNIAQTNLSDSLKEQYIQ